MCHPALARPSQVALTLRAVGGLSVEQIAAAYLVPSRTMTQRLTRARAALREAGANFEMPSADKLPARVAAMLDVCHLLFNEGYTRTSGESLVDDPAMQRHHRLHAVRAHLLELTGDVGAAAEHYRRAASLTASLPEQRYLNRRLRQLE